MASESVAEEDDSSQGGLKNLWGSRESRNMRLKNKKMRPSGPTDFSYGLTPKGPAGPDAGSERAGIANLEAQIAEMRIELEKRKKGNQKLRQELIEKEKTRSLSGNNGSLLMEKDILKIEISKLTSNLVQKNEQLRRLGATYKTLVDENHALEKKIKHLQKNEDKYDQAITEHSRVMEEYEMLRNVVDENEFAKHEQLFLTQMKLEENSRKQMEFQVKELGDKMTINKELAKGYLLKYIERLEAELTQLM